MREKRRVGEKERKRTGAAEVGERDVYMGPQLFCHSPVVLVVKCGGY